VTETYCHNDGINLYIHYTVVVLVIVHSLRYVWHERRFGSWHSCRLLVAGFEDNDILRSVAKFGVELGNISLLG